MTSIHSLRGRPFDSEGGPGGGGGGGPGTFWRPLTKTSSRSPSRIQKCRIQDFKSAISLDSLDGI